MQKRWKSSPIVNSEQLYLVMAKNTAKDMIKEYRKLYAGGNSLDAVQIRCKLTSLKCDEFDDAITHLSKFESLVMQLNDDDTIAYLTNTFPESYDSIIAYFDALNEDQRALNNLKARFRREYTTCKSRNTVNDEVIIFKNWIKIPIDFKWISQIRQQNIFNIVNDEIIAKEKILLTPKESI